MHERIERGIGRDQSGVSHHAAALSGQAVLPAEFHNFMEDLLVNLLCVRLLVSFRL
jgi:hypothetical protein